MSLATELAILSTWIQKLPQIGMKNIGEKDMPIFVSDLIMIGAVKRSLNLASGLYAMVNAQNMICARALLRMQLDTATRLLAYTYVEDPEAMAKGVISGTPLKKFKSTDGKSLMDGYLVDRMSKEHPWVRQVYDFTSGYVHFSERQLFDSVVTIGSDEERTFQLNVSDIDSKFPESSWEEVVACFNHLLALLEKLLSARKVTSQSAEEPN